jgi:hypothetical protein
MARIDTTRGSCLLHHPDVVSMKRIVEENTNIEFTRLGEISLLIKRVYCVRVF